MKKLHSKFKEAGFVGRFYPLRLALALIFGGGFVMCLIALVGIIMGYVLNGGKADSTVAYSGGFYASLVSMLIVSGVAYFVFAASLRRRQKGDVVARYIVMMFGAGVVGIAAIFAVATLYPLVTYAFGLGDMTWEAVAQTVTVGIVATVLLLVLFVYHIFEMTKKWAHFVVLGVFAALMLIVFAVGPAMQVREATKDQEISGELRSISYKISEFASENGRLPMDLGELKGKTPANITYEIRRVEGNSHFFMLCSGTFRLDTKTNDKDEHWDRDYDVHYSGWNCWETSEYIEY